MGKLKGRSHGRKVRISGPCMSRLRQAGKNLKSFSELVSKKFALLKKPMNPSRFRTHPAVPELFALCVIPAVCLKA